MRLQPEKNLKRIFLRRRRRHMRMRYLMRGLLMRGFRREPGGETFVRAKRFHERPIRRRLRSGMAVPAKSLAGIPRTPIPSLPLCRVAPIGPSRSQRHPAGLAGQWCGILLHKIFNVKRFRMASLRRFCRNAGRGQETSRDYTVQARSGRFALASSMASLPVMCSIASSRTQVCLNSVSISFSHPCS